MASLPVQLPQLTSPPPSMSYASTSTAANQPPSTSSSSASSNKHALPNSLNQEANETNSKKKKLKSEHMMCTDTATQQHEADGGAGFMLNINRNSRDNSMSSISQNSTHDTSNQQQNKSDTDMNHTKQQTNKNGKQNIDAKGFDKDKIERTLAASAHNKEVIELLDDSEEEEEEEEDTKPAAAKKIESSTAGEHATNIDLDKDIEKAIILSKQDQQTQKYYEGMDKDLMLIKRQELQDAIDSYVNLYGGYENIEKSKMIRDGNEGSIKKAFAAENWLGLKQQRGAQYGRYGIEALWRMFDMLEGKVDEYNNISSSEANEVCKLPADRGVKRERKSEEGSGLVGKPITAFLDIGHGLGIQVLQAGWALKVPSRGVEVMVQRDVIANNICDGVHDILSHDPPDKTMVEFKQSDFACSFVPNKHTGVRDEKLLDFLLFRDKPNAVQEGLVIFINNAEDVFAKRNYEDADTKSSDHYLAELFARMQIGGRMVTLTDVSMHLPCQREWFRRETLDSGPNAVSWHLDNKKSVTLYVLTKLRNKWHCDNQCPLATAVVDDYGDLSGCCVCCSFPAMRRSSERRRK